MPSHKILWKTGEIQRTFPLENNWTLVVELFRSAARIPLERSCLLKSAMSGFQRDSGDTLEGENCY